MKNIFLGIILFFFAIASCNDPEPASSNTNKLMEADKIEYQYFDKSVAPIYYRGYKITVTALKLKIEINSRANVLLEEERSFSEEKFEELKESFKDLQKKGEINKSEIRTGGTSERISFYLKGQKIIEGDNYGRNNRNFSGVNDISLAYLIPDLDKLIESTRKEKTNEE